MRQAAPVLQANIWTPEHAMLSSVVMPSGDHGYRTFPQLWVPIIHLCWSGRMPVLVEGAAEPVASADIELRDLLKIGNRLW